MGHTTNGSSFEESLEYILMLKANKQTKKMVFQIRIKTGEATTKYYLLLEYCFLYHHAVWKIAEEEPIKGKIFLSSTSSSPISTN